MNRFVKSAAFPILIVVVLAFFAEKLIAPSPNVGPVHSYETLVAKDLPGGQVQSAHDQDEGQHGRRHPAQRQKYSVGYVDGQRRRDAHHRPRERSEPSSVQHPGHRQQRLAVAADLRPPVPDLHRLLDLPDEPGPGRRVEGDVVRQVEGQADDGRFAEDHVPRRGRCRRGRRGAPRDQGVPREPEEVPGAWAREFRRVSSSTGRRAPARRCWPARSPARPVCRSSRSRGRTS